MSGSHNPNANYVHTRATMGTVASVHVVGHGTSQRARRERERTVARAMAWFVDVESVCSRFDPASELRQLCARVGVAVPVSAMLFEAVQFALAVADATDGAFDPTVGATMEARGFDRDYRSNAVVRSGVNADAHATFRDIELSPDDRAITLHRALLLDLGAVAKGLAIDMAARELAAYDNFVIDAGGDLYLAGVNDDGAAWSVGIRNPAAPSDVVERIAVSNVAVCTSGDYERPGHLVRANAHDASIVSTDVDVTASVSTIAASAMVADAMGTAAIVLGPTAGLILLEQHEVGGLVLTTDGRRLTTHHWPND